MQLLASMATGYALAALLMAVVGVSFHGAGGVVLYASALVLPMGVVGGLLAGLFAPGRQLGWVNQATWLGVVPAWGFFVNASLPDCTANCQETYAAVAWPGVGVVAASYVLALVGYVVHLRRPLPLRPLLELLVGALLVQGVVTCVLLVLQFGPQAPFGVILAPIGLPLIAPTVATVVLGVSATQRMMAVGLAAGARGPAFFLFCAGLWTLITSGRGPYLGAFGQTCGWTLSQLRAPEVDCHYLCTVAAQGNPWLVRPTRWGKRRGRPILVNRQLAVANAFEDLLHERWPRVGRLARAIYDRLAMDISRSLRRRWMANLLFVGMLPAQLLFEVFLLVFDPDDPEARIDRMYR